ncbi:DoxX family protein [Chitinophagaceae bacterium MMS25-I14]
MKTAKITFWITTSLIFLLEGVMPALTSNSEQAKQGISHLGYPDYFRIWLTVFKVAGSLLLIIPAFKGRIKEWAYAGFAFDFIFALISITAVDGFGASAAFPLVALVILAASYFSWHKMQGTAV